MTTDGEEVEIRLLNDRDWGLLRELRLTALGDSPSAFESSRDREQDLDESVWRDRAQRCAIATISAQPVGLIGWFHPDGDTTRIEIVSMWVRADVRRRGVATRLIDFVDEKIAGRIGAALELGVITANDQGRRAYERLGFQPVGTDIGVLTGRPIIRMQRRAPPAQQLDRHYVDPRLTALYDALCAGRPDFAFYLPLVMSCGSVLDVGCGTGELLRSARAAGHRGVLCGLDPAAAMLERARIRSDIEWITGTLTSFETARRFELATMTGHAFQVLLTDNDLAAALSNLRSLLADDGRFVFETRNPGAREWEQWTPDQKVTVIGEHGECVTVIHEVQAVHRDFVTFTMTFTSPSWDAPLTSTSTLRFLDIDSLATVLQRAGLVIEAQYGDWDQQPWTPTSPEIITICRNAPTRT